MKYRFISSLSILYCFASLIYGQNESPEQNFIYETKNRVLTKLKEHAEKFGENGNHLLKGIRNFEDPRQGVNWKSESTATFAQETFAPDTAFSYVYTMDNEMLVHQDAMAELLKLPAASSKLRTETDKMLSEMARSIGEQIIRIECSDFRLYWCRGDYREEIRKPSAHHLYDTEGRTNPVALYGLYAEYVMRHQNTNDTTERQGWHNFIKQIAERDDEYTKLATEAENHYPEDGKSLHQMLGYEATWSACWVMAKKALLAYCSNDKDAEKDGRRIINTVNKHIQALVASNLPEPQKKFIQQKYPMDKLTNGLNVPSDLMARLEAKAADAGILTPANAAEARQKEMEQKRVLRLAGICRLHADYIQLLPDDKAWELEEKNGSFGELEKYDDRTRKLVADVQLELFRAFTDHQDELNDLLVKVKDKATAEKYAPLVFQKQVEIAAAAMHMDRLNKEFKLYFSSKQKFHPILKQQRAEADEVNRRALISTATYNKLYKSFYHNKMGMNEHPFDSEAFGEALSNRKIKRDITIPNSSNPFAAADALRLLILMGGAL